MGDPARRAGRGIAGRNLRGFEAVEVLVADVRHGDRDLVGKHLVVDAGIGDRCLKRAHPGEVRLGSDLAVDELRHREERPAGPHFVDNLDGEVLELLVVEFAETVPFVGADVVDFRGDHATARTAAVHQGHRHDRDAGGFDDFQSGVLRPEGDDVALVHRGEHRLPCLHVGRVDVERPADHLILGGILIGGGIRLAGGEELVLGGFDRRPGRQVRFEGLGCQRCGAVHEVLKHHVRRGFHVRRDRGEIEAVIQRVVGEHRVVEQRVGRDRVVGLGHLVGGHQRGNKRVGDRLHEVRKIRGRQRVRPAEVGDRLHRAGLQLEITSGLDAPERGVAR